MSELKLKEPVKAVKPKTTGYLAILEDADGVAHFWLANGEYDGYDHPGGSKFGDNNETT